jgi:hypothetical protein
MISGNRLTSEYRRIAEKLNPPTLHDLEHRLKTWVKLSNAAAHLL